MKRFLCWLFGHAYKTQTRGIRCCGRCRILNVYPVKEV